MKKFALLKKCISNVLACVMFLSFFTLPVYADENISELVPYAEKVNRFNQEYGTAYSFNDGAFGDEETINFYKQFTLEEFDNYLYDMYLEELSEIKIQYEELSSNARRNTTQYVYYGKNFSNYFYVTHTVEYAYNNYVFVSCNSVGWYGGEYPHYSISSDTWQMNNTRTSNTITMMCQKYIGPSLIDLAMHTISFTVTPYGGDQYWLTVSEI